MRLRISRIWNLEGKILDYLQGSPFFTFRVEGPSIPIVKSEKVRFAFCGEKRKGNPRTRFLDNGTQPVSHSRCEHKIELFALFCSHFPLSSRNKKE
jgi:hypothetical protein